MLDLFPQKRTSLLNANGKLVLPQKLTMSNLERNIFTSTVTLPIEVPLVKTHASRIFAFTTIEGEIMREILRTGGQWNRLKKTATPKN